MSRLEVIRPRKPTFLERMGQTLRSYTLGPLSTSDPELRKYFQGSETTTGVTVSEYTALNYSAVWSAVRLISSDVASLPLVLYRRIGKGKDRYESHSLYRILHDAPNPEMSSLTFRQTLQAHALTWGDGYAEIERDAGGRVKYLWPLTPDRVTPFRDQERLLYRVTNAGNASDTIFDPADILHIPGLGWDGVKGYGVVSKARESIALGVAAEKFGGSFYGNGSTFGGVIRHPTRFATPAARENFEKSLRTRHKGIERAHGLLLIEEGMEYQQIGIPPDQAQFLESRQFQITEIARWFNVPPHKIGDLSRATFSNIEQQNIEYLQTTLIHWLETWEQELMRKLISPLERNQQFIEHVVEGLLRGDSQGRAALQTAEFQIGGLTPNESRGLANRDPVKGGDRPFVPLNMIPLDRVDEWIDAQIEGKKNKGTTPPPTGGGVEVKSLGEAVEELRVSLGLERAGREQESLEKRQAQQRAEDLSAALSQMEDRAELAEATLSQTIEHMDGARSALAAEQAERARDVAAKVAAADEWAQERSYMLEETQHAIDAVQALRESERLRADAAERERETIAAQLDTAQVERGIERAAIEAERDALNATIAKRDAALAQHEAVIADMANELAALTELRAEESARAVAAEAERDRLTGTLIEVADSYQQGLALAGQERDAARAKADAAEQQATDADSARDDARNALYAEQAAHARTQQERDEQAAAREQANAELQQTREHHAARVNGMLVAHRGLIVDVMRRMVEREIDRAKRHQATPQKFRAWIDAFYQTHTDAVAEALVPAVRAHLAILSSACDPHELARQLAEDHVAESAKQLRDLLHVEDFAPMLERTLAQWETSRPEDVADRLLTKGLADVR